MIAGIAVTVAGLYAVAGIVFALWFTVSAIHRFDPAARGTSPAFRAIVFPGAAALWPVLWRKWRART